MLRRWLGFVVVLASCAPSASDAPTHDVVGQSAPIIQGIDDRKQWYEVEREDQRERMRLSVAGLLRAVVPTDRSSPSSYSLDGATLEDRGFCADERFASEPSEMFCSATLVDDDVIMTAGHCLSDISCDEIAVVFDFYFSRERVMATTRFGYPDNVYFCRRILHQEDTVDSFTTPDFAFIQLDRRATDDGREVASISIIDAPVPGQQVYTAGFPRGIPMKYSVSSIDSFDAETHYFATGNDASPGNSGGGVFTSYGTVLGIVASGVGEATDDSDGCLRESVFPDAIARAIMFDAREATRRLCATGWSSRRLCGTTTPYCGDRECGDGENIDTCSDDCLAPVSWTCDDSYYGTADGCDCNCGTFDPDCNDSSQELFNCAAEQVCDASGECVDLLPEVTADAGVARDAGAVHTRPDAAVVDDDAPEDDSGCAIVRTQSQPSTLVVFMMAIGFVLRARRKSRATFAR